MRVVRSAWCVVRGALEASRCAWVCSSFFGGNMTGFFLDGKTHKPSPGGGLGRGLLATPKPEIRSPVHSQPASRLLHPTSRISTNNPPPAASPPPSPRGRQESVRSECCVVSGHSGPRPAVRRLWFSLHVYFAISQSVFSRSANIESPPLEEGWVGVLDAAKPERQTSHSWRTCSLRPRNNPLRPTATSPKGEACLFALSVLP